MRVRKHERPDSRPCDWCKSDYAPKNYRSRFCSLPCANASNNSVLRYDSGSCKQCGIAFRSRTPGKMYCSLKCYTDSPQWRDMARRNLTAMNPAVGTPRICHGCAAEYPRTRRAKFCTNACRRKYYAERFDRWIANPEGVALPQNYDEFMNRDDLACPVAGCEWIGKALGSHVNMIHGITADAFKALCGFNKTTGLVGMATSEIFSDRNKARIESGELQVYQPGHEPIGTRQYARGAPSLESREHQNKTRADMLPFKDEWRPCRQCVVVDVRQPMTGIQLYCSTRCRSKYYNRPKPNRVLTCAECATSFPSNSHQRKRAATGPVCCSISCRNKLNSQKPRKNQPNSQPHEDDR